MKKSHVLSVVGLLLTTLGVLSQLWFEELYLTYSFLGVGLLLCLVAIFLEVKRRINQTQKETFRKSWD
ncbi:hypothetical protein [Marinilabilia salmonicolor]|uniref:hypothetical protein n=1 Tax=Marinilabilia salmonicolor TaxID=989 RepID=UPI0011DF7D6F|nr:hypothetical protein [Marinilabilia salmonicolor]